MITKVTTTAVLSLFCTLALAANTKASTTYQCLTKDMQFQLSQENIKHKNYFNIIDAISVSNGDKLQTQAIFTPNKDTEQFEPVQTVATWASQALPEVKKLAGVWLKNNMMVCNFRLSEYVITKEQSPITMTQLISVQALQTLPEGCKLKGGRLSYKKQYCRGRKCRVVCTQKAVTKNDVAPVKTTTQ